MDILVGLPSVDSRVNVMVVHSFLDQLPFIVDGHHRIQCRTISHTLIHSARNGIAKDALNFDYLFFMDSDCVIPANTLKRLFEHDKDIVAGMYFQRREPFMPVIYRKNDRGTYNAIIDYPKDSLIEVDGVGMGVCLIKTKVLKALGDNPFDPVPAAEGSPVIVGEDLAFCGRAKDAGFKIYCDTGIQAAHEAQRYITEEYFFKALSVMKKQGPPVPEV